MPELQRPKFVAHKPKQPIPDLEAMSHPQLVSEMKFLNRRIHELSTELESRGRRSPVEVEQIKQKQKRMIVRHRTIQTLIQSLDFETFASCFIKTAQEYLPQEVYDSIERRAKTITKDHATQ